MWAATLAGTAFGNAGVHAPHAMAYAIAGRAGGGFRPAGYPDAPLVPHGMAVALNVPAVVRHTGGTSPARHLEAAALLGADVRGADDADAGELLAREVIRLMQAVAMPNGAGAVGYTAGDVGRLVEGTLPQQRLLDNAPCALPPAALAGLFERALRYW